MSMIVHMMASGAKPKFSQEEYREIVQEADILFKEGQVHDRYCLSNGVDSVRIYTLPYPARLSVEGTA